MRRRAAQLEIEVVLGVVVGDVLHHPVDERHLRCRKFAVSKVAAEHVAQNPAEILMTRIVFNRYIKEICHRLSDTTPSLAVMERTKLNKKEMTREKAARKTAITNMFLNGKIYLKPCHHILIANCAQINDFTK